MDASRDLVDWVVIGATVLSGFAALIAVWVGAWALRLAHEDREDAKREREHAQRERERSHALALLTTLQRVWVDLENLQQNTMHGSGGEVAFNIYRGQMRIALAAFGLRRRTPLTYALLDRSFTDDWTGFEDRFEAARAEIAQLIEYESDRAYADEVLEFTDSPVARDTSE